MEFLKAIREDPLLMSMIAFPLGNIILLAVGKLLLFPKTNLGKVVNDFLEEYRKHVQAEIKLDEHIKGMIDKVEDVLASIWDFRRFVDLQMDDFSEYRRRSRDEHEQIIAAIEALKTPSE